jgi:hypothetical protein
MDQSFSTAIHYHAKSIAAVINKKKLLKERQSQISAGISTF